MRETGRALFSLCSKVEAESSGSSMSSSVTGSVNMAQFASQHPFRDPSDPGRAAGSEAGAGGPGPGARPHGALGIGSGLGGGSAIGSGPGCGVGTGKNSLQSSLSLPVPIERGSSIHALKNVPSLASASFAKFREGSLSQMNISHCLIYSCNTPFTHMDHAFCYYYRILQCYKACLSCTSGH